MDFMDHWLKEQENAVQSTLEYFDPNSNKYIPRTQGSTTKPRTFYNRNKRTGPNHLLSGFIKDAKTRTRVADSDDQTFWKDTVSNTVDQIVNAEAICEAVQDVVATGLAARLPVTNRLNKLENKSSFSGS